MRNIVQYLLVTLSPGNIYELGNLVIIGLGNGLAPVLHQAIT